MPTRERRDYCGGIYGSRDIHGFERIGLLVVEFLADDVAGFEVAPLVVAPAVGRERLAHHLRQGLRTAAPVKRGAGMLRERGGLHGGSRVLEHGHEAGAVELRW